MPAHYQGLWVAVDGSKSLHICRDHQGQLRVHIWTGFGEQLKADNLLARFNPRSAHSEHGLGGRLDTLSVELGAEGLGSTYELMFAVEDRHAHEGAFKWVAPSTDDVAELRVFPEVGTSYYEAMLGPYDDLVEELDGDDAWLYPLSTYRPATEAERARHPSHSR